MVFHNICQTQKALWSCHLYANKVGNTSLLKMSFFGLYLRFLSSSTLSFTLVPKCFSWISKREPILHLPWEVPWRSHRIKTVISKLLIQIAIRKHCSFPLSSSYPSILLCCCLLPVRRLTQCLLSREVSGRQPLTRMRRGGCDVRRAGRRGEAAVAPITRM